MDGYRSEIICYTEEQARLAERSMVSFQKDIDKEYTGQPRKVLTCRILARDAGYEFYEAPERQQDFFAKEDDPKAVYATMALLCSRYTCFLHYFALFGGLGLNDKAVQRRFWQLFPFS